MESLFKAPMFRFKKCLYIPRRFCGINLMYDKIDVIDIASIDILLDNIESKRNYLVFILRGLLIGFIIGLLFGLGGMLIGAIIGAIIGSIWKTKKQLSSIKVIFKDKETKILTIEKNMLSELLEVFETNKLD
jgi:hypothetical protein